jgi:hypothetical protein
MLLEKYKGFIKELTDATRHGKLEWSKGTSSSSFYADRGSKIKILLDTYNAQVGQAVNSCINLAIFDGQVNIPVEEMVICDQAANQADDYALISELYQLVKQQYSDKAISPILAEFTQSLR